jgi:hypothetical protein
MALPYEFDSPEFDQAVAEATHKAFQETLAAGLPVFYVDDEGIDMMQCPDGRRFEIRWIPGAPSGENYEIIRELKAHAA